MKKIISLVFAILILSLIDSCAPPASCSDGKQNQGEVGIDCGGPCTDCPTCMDGVQNQNETAVDCGGPCIPCVSCSDGIQNQGETGIDCGGPCTACASCSDGIQNQGETGIDCGGPCQACASISYPKTGSFGLNILGDSIVKIKLIPGTVISQNYSFAADLPASTTLKIKITAPSTITWSTDPAVTVWTITNIPNGAEFSATGAANKDMYIKFERAFGSTGLLTIEYYENGALTPTKTKTLNLDYN